MSPDDPQPPCPKCGTEGVNCPLEGDDLCPFDVVTPPTDQGEGA